MISTIYRVDGLTCGHCVSAVMEELSALDGVDAVTVDLTAGGTSTVTVTAPGPLSEEQIVAALHEAGDYHLAARSS